MGNTTAINTAARALQRLRPDFTLTNATTFVEAILAAPPAVFAAKPLAYLPVATDPAPSRHAAAPPQTRERTRIPFSAALRLKNAPHDDDAYLSVPIGTASADGSVVELTFAPTDAAPGATGRHGRIEGVTGSGKTWLTAAIASGLSARYSPDRLNLILVTTGRGEVLSQLTNAHVLEHIAKDRTADPNAAIAMIRNQIESRTQRLASAGVMTADEYRRHWSTEPGSGLRSMPELFIILEDTLSHDFLAADHVATLTDALVNGDRLGINLLFVDQLVDGYDCRSVLDDLDYAIGLHSVSPRASIELLGTDIAATGEFVVGLAHLSTDRSRKPQTFTSFDLDRIESGGRSSIDRVLDRIGATTRPSAAPQCARGKANHPGGRRRLMMIAGVPLTGQAATAARNSRDVARTHDILIRCSDDSPTAHHLVHQLIATAQSWSYRARPTPRRITAAERQAVTSIERRTNSAGRELLRTMTSLMRGDIVADNWNTLLVGRDSTTPDVAQALTTLLHANGLTGSRNPVQASDHSSPAVAAQHLRSAETQPSVLVVTASNADAAELTDLAEDRGIILILTTEDATNVTDDTLRRNCPWQLIVESNEDVVAPSTSTETHSVAQ
ncbi:FtsK/SpoIIIE domain-containing protein [Gordonia sihwensis]|uniref:FtsK/SpoIIIE domain-containing protein n=1 Tax=Gordonia sihwensis TaxID=173559 RepID=UPI003D95F7A9